MHQLLNEGVVCALGREHAKRIFSARDKESLTAALSELLESASPDQVAACQGQWKPLHACLTAVTPPSQDAADPLAAALLGGRHLQRESGLVVSMVRPDMVPIVAEALEALEPSGFAARCKQLVQADVDQLWSVVTRIAAAYRRASDENSAVVFAVIGDVDERP